MLRRFLDWQMSLTEKGKPLEKFRPLIQAGDVFLYEAPINTGGPPHIRDAVDVKRWMMLVIYALIPAILFGIWNTGLQTFVYSSGDYRLMNEYLAVDSFKAYADFAFKNDRYLSIWWIGLKAVVPIIIISYAVGGLVEALFAILRGHEISEGFLVSGILYALVLPSTLPYWMVAVGVAVGIFISKEIFGGSGMNIVNPALACRCFLFFTFPGRMSGDVWVGTNSSEIRTSLVKMNHDAQTTGLDGYTQATALAKFNVTPEIKKIHVDAIASNNLQDKVSTWEVLQNSFQKWTGGASDASLGQLTQEQLQSFVTTPLAEGGLGLSPGNYEDAYRLASLNYGFGHNNDWNFFFGDRIGSIGETSILAILIGAFFLILTGVGSWRTMAAMALGVFLTASVFEWSAKLLGADGGAWAPAQFTFPAYKHLLLGGLAFGIVFMATDPVSSPASNLGKWIFGLFCGVVTLVIRAINPAYPEGAMLAILMGNCLAPLIDYYSVAFTRKKRRAAYVTAYS